MELDKLKLLALDLISPHCPVAGEVLAALDENDWAGLGTLLRQHRLEPLLYWRLSRERQSAPVPGKFLQGLEDSFKASTLRSLGLQRELLCVHRILEQASVPNVMLKGAFLAFHAYPHPAMRPMRDIDVLVPRDKALAAYQALINAGYEHFDVCNGDAAASLDVLNHLPPLRSTVGAIQVDLHTRLIHKHEQGAQYADVSEGAEFWSRLVQHPIAGTPMSFASATDLLFHLIEHAVYHHKLNNGPLLLSDLAYLIAHAEIDWELFWRLARERDQERGCVLALELAQQCHGEQKILWPLDRCSGKEEIPVREAVLSMFQESRHRENLLLNFNMAQNQSFGARLVFILQKIFPSRREIASIYPVSAMSYQVYLWYLVKWWSLLRSRLPSYLKSIFQPGFLQDAEAMRAVDRWLR